MEGATWFASLTLLAHSLSRNEVGGLYSTGGLWWSHFNLMVIVLTQVLGVKDSSQLKALGALQSKEGPLGGQRSEVASGRDSLLPDRL